MKPYACASAGACAALAIFALGAGQAPLAADLAERSRATAALADQVLQSTVRLSQSPGLQGVVFGSGFVVDATQGYVVTNHHVVTDVEAEITVTLHDGRHVQADVVGTDPGTDLAVLRILPGFARTQLPWGDSDALRPGSMVLAVGSPLDLTGSTSLGVIGGLGRVITDDGQLEIQDFLQIDAFIDHGSSGGPLVDMRGAVVGVNTAIRGSNWQGIGYAVPSAIARRVVDDLIRHGAPRRSYLGVSDMSDVTARYAELNGLERPFGARVQEVAEGSPAEAAGVRRGDVILKIDGKEIWGRNKLIARVQSYPPGATITLDVWRDGKVVTLRATLSTRER